jgi:predicted Zn-dependent peptidase
MLVLGVGARYEDPQTTGISHFLEHLVFTGTQRWDEEEVHAFIPALGGESNGWTTSEMTAFYVRVPAQHLAPALDWLAQLAFHPTFPADKIDRERLIIEQERRMRDDNNQLNNRRRRAEYSLNDQVRAVLFPGANLELSTIGTDRTLACLDRDAIIAHYERYYWPNNAALVVAGGSTPGAVLHASQRSFRRLDPNFVVPRPPTPTWPKGGPHRLIVDFWPSDQVRVAAGARTVGLSHPDRWALEVLARSLQREVRQTLRHVMGLAYAPFVVQESLSDVGYLELSTEVSWRYRDAALEIFQDALDRAKRGDISKQTVSREVAALAGQGTIYGDDPMVVAESLADWALLLSDDQALPDEEQAVQAVRPSDLTRVAQHYFQPESSYVGWCEPLASREGMRRVGRKIAHLPSYLRQRWCAVREDDGAC